MSRYRRLWVPGGTYFFTVNLLERRRCLLVDEIDLLRSAFRATHALRPFEMIAAVVLPDHLHCIWRLPPGDADNASRWRQIKTLFSRGIVPSERLSVSRRRRGERGIWQRRYWEHWLRDERDLARHVDYIHWNPVKHGLVDRVEDWPCSSFHRYVRDGLLPMGWGCGNHASNEVGRDPPYNVR